MASNFYAVLITTPESGEIVSRYFQTIKAARKWAAWTAANWPTRILKGGQGGEVVR
jgi:hypothetical protein